MRTKRTIKPYPRKRSEPLYRFFEKVEVTETCWRWTATKSHDGYGLFKAIPGTNYVRPHRWLYEQLVAPIPDGLTIDHLCRVRLCVRPEHLEPVTALENHRRWVAAITHCKRGHPFDAANTRWVSPTKRSCRACARRLQRESYARNASPEQRAKHAARELERRKRAMLKP